MNLIGKMTALAHYGLFGSGKGFSQIKDIPDSYVVNDGVELGIGRKIPIWLFGLMY